VHMWECNTNNENQMWEYNKKTGLIKHLHGNCLDASERNKNGGKIHMWSCNADNKNQQWQFSSTTGILKIKEGKCFDSDQRNKNGGRVHMWECNSNNINQKWVISGLDNDAIDDTEKLPEIVRADGGDWVEAQCPTGKKVIGGGCDAKKSPHTMEYNGPNGDRKWKCGGHGGDKTAWAICLATDDVSIKEENGGDWKTVKCDGGKKVIGGGCQAKNNPHRFERNAPQGDDGWKCGGHGGNKRVWAICSSTINVNIKSQNGGDWKTVECNGGQKVIGGGCRAKKSPHKYQFAGPVGDNKYKCGGHGGDKKVWAICMSPKASLLASSQKVTQAKEEVSQQVADAKVSDATEFTGLRAAKVSDAKVAEAKVSDAKLSETTEHAAPAEPAQQSWFGRMEGKVMSWFGKAPQAPIAPTQVTSFIQTVRGTARKGSRSSNVLAM